MKSGFDRCKKILPPWMIVIIACFLGYMAWYLVQSDGLEYYADGELVSSVSVVAVFLAAAGITLAAFLCYAVVSTNPSYERLFLALWLMLGLVYFLAQPVMSEPDAKTHYLRTLDVVKGEWISSKDENGDASDTVSIPLEWVDDGDSIRLSFYDAQNYADYTVEDEANLFTYNNTAVYSPFSYLTQAFGYLLARLFTNRLIPILNIMRVVNYLITGMIYLLAVHLMPYSKKYIIWAALMPMNLHEAMGIDTDAMISALVALLLAACLYLRCDPDSRVTKPVIALLYITAFFVSQYKIVYVGACLLLFLIPPAAFRSNDGGPTENVRRRRSGQTSILSTDIDVREGSVLVQVSADRGRLCHRLTAWIQNNRRYLMHVLLLGTLIVAASVGWLMISTQGLLGQYSDSHGQLMIVLQQPWIYIAALLRSILRRSGTYLNQMMGSYMGAFLVKNNMVLIYGVTAAIALISLVQYLMGRRKDKENRPVRKPAGMEATGAGSERYTEERLSSGTEQAAGEGTSGSAATGTKSAAVSVRKDHGLGWKGRLNLLISSGITILLIFTSEYILWTNYMGRYVDGIQGRYFIPVVPLMLAALFGLQKDNPEQERPQYALLLGLNLCVALNAFVSWLYLTGASVAY